MEGLGLHDGMRCKARINLILALDKWQEWKRVVFAITRCWGVFMQKFSSLTFDLRGEVFSFSFSVKKILNSQESNPNLFFLSNLSLSLQPTLSLSLSLHPPSRSQEGRRSRAPPAAARSRGRAARSRGRAAPGRVWLRQGGKDLCLAKIQPLGWFWRSPNSEIEFQNPQNFWK